MIKKFLAKSMGHEKSSWLESRFHFSFGRYINEERVQFGVLRVVNDDIIQPSKGFDTHPHNNMEIISYIVKGKLTHRDNMNNAQSLSRGDFQYMSAGTGITHSEYNDDTKTPTRIIQMWILPDKKGHTPNYGDFSYDSEKRKNQFFHGVSSKSGNAPIQINQDANIYVSEIEVNKSITFELKKNRQCYLVQIEGSSVINGETLNSQDALEAIEETLVINAKSDSHILIIEMEKTNK